MADETTKPRGLSEREVGELFTRLKAYDERFDKQDGLLQCILEGINGTAQVKGIAGHVRDLNTWRSEIEKDKPLAVQLEEIRAWQGAINRVIIMVGVPITLFVIIGALTLLWGLLTNHIDLIVH